jgi:hypothetical protein
MILKEELEAGRVKFARDLRVVDALGKVRYAPDGKVDPETVDPSVRALANAVAYFRYREELKQIPLLDVQRAYFDFLEHFFSRPFSEMKRHKASPHEIAKDMASTGSLVKAFASEAEEFGAAITDFWHSAGPVVHAHLEDLRCLKSVYGGDISPSYTANIACSVGLYVDTIVLPDPLLRIARFPFRHMRPERTVYYTAKHALNVLGYKELALAGVEPPIVVIAPDHSALDEWAMEYLAVGSEADVVEHCSRLFGRTFADAEQLASFLGQLTTAEQVLPRLADPSRLLFDVEWSEPLDQQMGRFIDETLSDLGVQIGGRHIGEALRLALTGRMMQINDLLFESSQYRGTPLMDAPTSWQYLLWKYEYDRDRGKQLLPEMGDVLVSQALRAQGQEELGLISGLPPKALIDLRREGALVELRDILRSGIAEIDLASPSALSQVTETVAANISAAFSEHKRQLAALSASRRRFFGVQVTPWITVGGISIAAASAGNIPLSILAASVGMLGVPSARDLWKHGKDLLSKSQELKRSPTGILFRHLGDKTR